MGLPESLYHYLNDISIYSNGQTKAVNWACPSALWKGWLAMVHNCTCHLEQSACPVVLWEGYLTLVYNCIYHIKQLTWFITLWEGCSTLFRNYIYHLEQPSSILNDKLTDNWALVVVCTLVGVMLVEFYLILTLIQTLEESRQRNLQMTSTSCSLVCPKWS